jgi:hypothetical protein
MHSARQTGVTVSRSVREHGTNPMSESVMLAPARHNSHLELQAKKTDDKTLISVAAMLLSTLAFVASAQVSEETVQSLSAPASVETSIGTLEFKDDAPSADTAQKVADALDFTRALNAYNNSFRGASALALF